MFKKNMKNLMNTKKTKDKVKPQKEMEKKVRLYCTPSDLYLQPLCIQIAQFCS